MLLIPLHFFVCIYDVSLAVQLYMQLYIFVAGTCWHITVIYSSNMTPCVYTDLYKSPPLISSIYITCTTAACAWDQQNAL